MEGQGAWFRLLLILKWCHVVCYLFLPQATEMYNETTQQVHYLCGYVACRSVIADLARGEVGLAQSLSIPCSLIGMFAGVK